MVLHLLHKSFPNIISKYYVLKSPPPTSLHVQTLKVSVNTRLSVVLTTFIPKVEDKRACFRCNFNFSSLQPTGVNGVNQVFSGKLLKCSKPLFCLASPINYQLHLPDNKLNSLLSQHPSNQEWHSSQIYIKIFHNILY